MLNQVIIMGNLTKDPELRYAPSGTAMGSFSMALNSKQKGKDGNYKEEVSYIQVSTFGKVAENCSEYLKKGSKAIVQGRLKQERWEKDGQKHYAVKVIAALVTFLDGKQGGGNQSRGHQEEDVY